MASVSVLACNAFWARLIFAESNWKCLWLRYVAVAIESLPPVQYITDVHSVTFYVHYLGTPGRDTTGSERYRFCHIVAGV
jgi:hypothetical protein